MDGNHLEGLGGGGVNERKDLRESWVCMGREAVISSWGEIGKKKSREKATPTVDKSQLFEKS